VRDAAYRRAQEKEDSAMNQLRAEDTSSERAELGMTPSAQGEVSSEVKEQAKKIEKTVRERALELAEARRGSVASGLHHLAGRIEEVAHDPENGREVEELARYTADMTHRVADVLKNKPSEELLEMTRRGIRERPALCVAGFFALGFLGARLLRE